MAVALAVGPANVPAFAQAISGTVNVRDYVSNATCATDVTAQFNQAVGAWRSGQVNRTAGTLYIPAGCYQLNDTVWMLPPSGQPMLYGTVRGDGPGLTTIQGICGKRTMVLRNFQGGEFGGIHFSGRCGPGNQNRNTNQWHTALTIGSTTPAMGTNRVRFHNMTCEHYSRCYVLGDYATGGSSAELLFTNVGASQSQIGFHVNSYNTLDIHFDQSNVGDTDHGFYVSQAYGIHWTNGAGSNNWSTFHLASSGEFTIRGWREEPAELSGRWLRMGGPAADAHVTVIGSTIADRLKRPNFLAISQETPAANLVLIGSTILGQIDVKKVNAIGNTLIGSGIAKKSGYWLNQFGNCVGEINSGSCTADIVPSFTGL